MFEVAAVAILITMALALTRALLGPTGYDRILAVNMFGTKTVLMVAVLGFLTGRPDFLDLDLVYGLINFIGIIAVLKFFELGNLGASGVNKSVNTSAPNAARKTNGVQA